MSISPARIAAYECLLRIERDAAFSSILLPEYESKLGEKDRRLCHLLVLGVLRRKMFLDAMIDHFAGGKKIDIEIRVILRLGLFQLRYLYKVPDHSAVNESVSLAVKAKKVSAKGFVNALLRRLLREEFVLKANDETDRIAIEESHPKWLLKRWAEQFGPERAEAFAAANNSQPASSYRITRKGRQEGIDNNIEDLHAASESGSIYFQDEASQMVGNAVHLPISGRFLDVCAAPGSKTSLIADRTHDERTNIIAGDKYLSRVRHLRANCLNQGLSNVRFVQYDAHLPLPFADATFDAVLVDAPCSGTGTIRSNPEIRYTLKPEDIASLQKKQLDILTNASKLVKNGGDLYYSTCSLESEENEEVIRLFTEENRDFSVADLDIPERYLTGRRFGRTFPDRDNMDGFFIARLRRG